MGKESWWRKLVPKCGSSKSPAPDTTKKQSNMIPLSKDGVGRITCAHCGEYQPVIETLSAFVCCKCHKVNRIVMDDSPNGCHASIVEPKEDNEPVMLVRTSSSTFLPAEFVEDVAKQRKEMEPVIPQCTVCMDGAGDVVLLPCSHSAICEECAKHIAKNKSVGGSHCPRCREQIKQLLRLSEVYPEGDAKGVPVAVPKEEVRSGPPKVPPPPGHNKAKNNT